MTGAHGAARRSRPRSTSKCHSLLTAPSGLERSLSHARPSACQDPPPVLSRCERRRSFLRVLPRGGMEGSCLRVLRKISTSRVAVLRPPTSTPTPPPYEVAAGRAGTCHRGRAASSASRHRGNGTSSEREESWQLRARGDPQRRAGLTSPSLRVDRRGRRGVPLRARRPVSSVWPSTLRGVRRSLP